MDFSTNQSMSNLLQVKTFSLEGTNSKWWQQKMLCLLGIYEVWYVFDKSRGEYQQLKWDRDNWNCKSYIVNSLSNDLHDFTAKLIILGKSRELLIKKMLLRMLALGNALHQIF